MIAQQLLVHYGELSTKGRNKKMFIERLANHIRQKADHIPGLKVVGQHDFMHIYWEGDQQEALIQILAKIPGIQSYAPVFITERTMEAIGQEAKRLFTELNPQDGESFRVVARRSDREFKYDSMDLQRQIGSVIGEAFPQMHVDLDHPTYSFRVHIQQDGAYLSLRSYPGLGGLPFGSSGRALLMLSGGFDSPIAGYQMIKRGVHVAMVHFSSPPYTSEGSLIKTKKLTAKLANYSMPIKFYNVPFTRIQEAIKEQIPDGHTMTITRRMMLRITDRLLESHRAQAIITGESLGQVASQTMDSMVSINAVTNTPILRPLIATDKNDIIAIARQIDTYDLSNEPFEDCCTVFAPTSPKTRPEVTTMEALEEQLDIEGLIEEALAAVEIEHIDVNYLDRLTESFDDLL